MRTIVTLVAAIAFMLHFALGCCAHHAHAGEGHRSVAQNGAAKLAHCCSHDGHHHDGPDQGDEPQEPLSDSDCPEQHCEEGNCVFMSAGKTVLEKTSFVALLPLFAAESSVETVLSSLNVAAIDSGGNSGLPVRIHLFNQVLLI